MKEPSLTTLKRLFAVSGNCCAFPKCEIPIVEDSGTVTGIVCHIKAQRKRGPRYDAKQTPEERHGFGNLILMCSRHSKLIDTEFKTFTVELLQEMKTMHERQGAIEISPGDARKVEALQKDYRTLNITAGGNVMVDSPGAIQAERVTIKATKNKIHMIPPEGTLASDAVRRNYIKHLIDRYNEFAKQQKGRTNFTYAAIYSLIKKEHGAHWEQVSLARFEDLSALLQRRIDRTQLGAINRAKGIRNYSTFEEYCRKYGG